MKRFGMLLGFVLFCGLFMLILSQEVVGESAVGTSTTITYSASSLDFANPERGFYHHVETRGSSQNAYNLALLQGYRANENITLIYCINVLDTFVDTPISQSFLTHLQSNLNTVRSAGLKCILRFSYTDIVNNGNGSWPPVPPYGDATKAQMLAHIEQLRPLLQANSDVIATMQMGFIGIWGEGYYTDYFVEDPFIPWLISAGKWQDRRDVMDAIQAALPPSRMAAVRYAEAKQNMFATTTPLALADAYDGSQLARTSFHNDCFLASDTDFGTWATAAGKTYMADESRFLAMGGESCNYNPPRSACANALVELALFHWSYANIEYHPNVVTNPDSPESWFSGGCLEDIRKQLGYRFELQQASVDDATRPGHQFSLDLTLENRGFAAPFNPRPVQLLLRHTGTGDIYVAPLPDDPRFWFGGETAELTHNICLPNDIPTGDYDLLLNLPDRAPALRQRPEYAILLANSGGVQEASTGYNRLLHTLTVDASAPANACDNAIDALLMTAVPTVPSLSAQLSDAVDLTWSATSYCTLNLHHAMDPYFTLSAETIYNDTFSAEAVTYAVPLEAAPHYYAVEAVGCDGVVSAEATHVGTFPFAIQPGES